MCNWDEAFARFKDAIEKAKTNEELVEFYCNRANCYYDNTEYAKATADLDSALEKDNTNSKVHYQQGLTWYAYEKYKKAIKSFKLALHNQPLITHEPDIFYHLGLSYSRL